MKKALVAIGLLLLIGYIFFAIFWTKDKPMEGICAGVEVVFDDESNAKSITADELIKILDAKKLNPSGKSLAEINTYEIQEAVLSSQVVKDAKVYITGNHVVCVAVEERVPVLRVMADGGENYYIDSEGERFPVSRHFAAYIPLATGAIKEAFAKEELYKFALFLQEDKFWNAQIEQIVVLPNKDVKFIPRVGDQEIILGSLSGYEAKLDRLMSFYKKGQNNIGWNKYKEINLKFDEQVVGTKR